MFNRIKINPDDNIEKILESIINIAKDVLAVIVFTICIICWGTAMAGILLYLSGGF